jgi:hypothetical protein
METSHLKIVDSIPWREAFPEYREEDLPGVSLLGARTKEGMTQTRLAELTGIPQPTPFHDGERQAAYREEKRAPGQNQGRSRTSQDGILFLQSQKRPKSRGLLGTSERKTPG